MGGVKRYCWLGGDVALVDANVRVVPDMSFRSAGRKQCLKFGSFQTSILGICLVASSQLTNPNLKNGNPRQIGRYMG